MIRRAPAHIASDDTPFFDLEKCMSYELTLLFKKQFPDEQWAPGGMADFLVANRQIVLDILTTTLTSKTAARKINGGRKVRKSKAQPQPSLLLVQEGQ